MQILCLFLPTPAHSLELKRHENSATFLHGWLSFNNILFSKVQSVRLFLPISVYSPESKYHNNLCNSAADFLGLILGKVQKNPKKHQ